MNHKFTFRMLTFTLLIGAMLLVFIGRLYQLQVIQANKIDPSQPNTYTYRTQITAARGEILDRNGNVLVGNRASFNIILVYDVLFSSGNPNENLRLLTNICQEHGLEIVEHLPVTGEKPYAYTTDQTSATWNNYFKIYLSERDWDSDISAPQLISRLKDRYNIPQDWSEEEARRVIAVRYELELRHCTNLPTYELVQDVDTVSLAAITELNIPGVNVLASTVREYYTTKAAHILGYVGDMNSDEYAIYKEHGYAMDAQVGKEGLEKAFELELHGTNGLKETTISKDGTILSERYIIEPVAGNNVELSIDLDLQTVAEDALEDMILDMRENGATTAGAGKDAEGGAVVAMDIKTGQVLVCASYPTYNLATFFEDWNETSQQPYSPFFNRALQAEYPPGSVYKMVTTIAAIDNNVANRYYEIEDLGVYRRFESSAYTPQCMLYTTTGGNATHGSVNAMEALAGSCNYYFYELGWLTGIERIDETAKALGLGEPTGVEIFEETGYRANPETKEQLYHTETANWYGGDVISAAIGQSDNRFTPMQLCSYTAAVANQGTRYKATFLRRVLSADYDTLLRDNPPTVLSHLDISDEAYLACKEGMQMATTEYYGTATAFRNYSVSVCAKTGTAEHGSGGSDNASFVIYAPADDPQIAISIYVEKGAQGGKLSPIAMAILDAYFSEASAVDTVPGENTLN